MTNNKRTKKVVKEYDLAHKLGKLICAIINTLLFVAIFKVDHYVLFFLANLTYFFGVNSVARLIEMTLNYRKKHEIL